MTGHEFRPTSSVNRILYSSEGVLLSFEAASSGSLINHDFLDVTMTTIKVEIAGGSEYAFLCFYEEIDDMNLMPSTPRSVSKVSGRGNNSVQVHWLRNWP